MASSYTPNRNYELITTGEQNNTWGVSLNNAVFSVIDLNLGGRLALNCAGSSDVTLTSTQARNLVINCTGLLTGNISVIVPNQGAFYFIYNNTTGNFTLTVKPSGGTGIVVPQTQRAFLFANPTSGAMEDYTGRLVGGGWQAESTVTAAATTDILGATTNFVLISGTGGPITSLGTGSNRIRFVRFDNAATLTHNATSLILPGAANIVTAAGDTCIVESDGSSNARVYAYQRALALPAPAIGQLATNMAATTGVSSTSSSFADITGLTTAVQAGTYFFVVALTGSATNNVGADCILAVNGPTLTTLSVQAFRGYNSTGNIGTVAAAVTAYDTDIITLAPPNDRGFAVLLIRLVVSAAGTFAVRFKRTGGAGTATVNGDSLMIGWRSA